MKDGSLPCLPSISEKDKARIEKIRQKEETAARAMFEVGVKERKKVGAFAQTIRPCMVHESCDGTSLVVLSVF